MKIKQDITEMQPIHISFSEDEKKELDGFFKDIVLTNVEQAEYYIKGLLELEENSTGVANMILINLIDRLHDTVTIPYPNKTDYDSENVNFIQTSKRA